LLSCILDDLNGFFPLYHVALNNPKNTWFFHKVI
jgi:hypothetical protein